MSLLNIKSLLRDGIGELFSVANPLEYEKYDRKGYLKKTEQYLRYGFEAAETEAQKEDGRQLELKGT